MEQELSTADIEDLKKLLTAQRAPTPAANEAVQVPSSFTVNVGGSSYRVSSEEEAQRLFDQLEAQRGQEIENERVRTQAEQQRREQLEASLPGRQTRDEFSKEEYARLFLDDPRKAHQYMTAHDPNQKAFYGQLVAKINSMEQENAATQFVLKHKEDYVPNADNFKAISGLMTEYKLPWSVQGMELAFNVAKAQGAITGGRQQRQDAQQEDQESGEPGIEDFVPAPRVARRRTSQNTADTQIEEQFQELSPEKQKLFLLNYGKRG